ncbi:MAG: choice-of-anchor I family protein [Cyanobacteria bacterium P01_F01_bin.53]
MKGLTKTALLARTPTLALLTLALLTLVLSACKQRPAPIIPTIIPNGSTLVPISTLDSGLGAGGVEVSAYAPLTQQLIVTNPQLNTIDIFDLSEPTQPTHLKCIDLNNFGNGVNSVETRDHLIAVSIKANPAQNPGTVVVFDSVLGGDGQLLKQFAVGADPDHLTFTPDGNKLLVANEGTPSGDYTVDPEGSVSIIDLTDGIEETALETATVKTASFSQFEKDRQTLSLRIFGPRASVAQDIEPEYIAMADDGKTAYVSLQENNGIGVLDLEKEQFTELLGLKAKDHGKPENGLDASDHDNQINIQPYPGVFGLYQPDAIATYTHNNNTFIVTANEGAIRDYDGFSEKARVKDLTLDPDTFPPEATRDEALGRLEVTTTLGDTDNDGIYEALYAYGARSFSIFDSRGTQVFDSGNSFERIIAEQAPNTFNAKDGESDQRSDDQGPAPEGLSLGKVGDRTFAFITYERPGGIFVYDITEPTQPTFELFTPSESQDHNEDLDEPADTRPEGNLFISAKDSPNGQPLLVVTNEGNGTLTIYQLEGF